MYGVMHLVLHRGKEFAGQFVVLAIINAGGVNIRDFLVKVALAAAYVADAL